MRLNLNISNTAGTSALIRDPHRNQEKGKGKGIRAHPGKGLVPLVLLVLGGAVAGCPLNSSSPPITLEVVGKLHVLWGDGPPGSETAQREYWLLDDQGRWYRLLLAEDLLERWGGPLALEGKRVRIRAEAPEPSSSVLRVLSLQVEKPALARSGGRNGR